MKPNFLDRTAELSKTFDRIVNMICKLAIITVCVCAIIAFMRLPHG